MQGEATWGQKGNATDPLCQRCLITPAFSRRQDSPIADLIGKCLMEVSALSEPLTTDSKYAPHHCWSRRSNTWNGPPLEIPLEIKTLQKLKFYQYMKSHKFNTKPHVLDVCLIIVINYSSIRSLKCVYIHGNPPLMLKCSPATPFPQSCRE